ncbi:site-specific integrase [Ralstonia solanacearum]|uniref:Site-specific integrase n=1 Tax=Ralstonia solanacearum TaxID=305 RepID=A0AAE3NNT2_RALSL|nr:site-specific integrase [Ralstonia solanacearum]MBB6580932.1 site-specific integrase [Ralstonia solanacearum]MDB0524299.1 site-specific integrase [Ralstonia solanacearum]
MPKPPVIEEHQIRHALKVAAVTGQNSKRDVALLLVAYGTGLMPNEIAKLLVSDYLQANGQTRIESLVRAEIAFNGKVRPLLWASAKVRAAIDTYLEHRLVFRHGITTSPAAYHGLEHQSPLFLTGEGAPFAFTRRVTAAGAISYSCESLAEIFRRLHQQAGITCGNASSARRTFAITLHRQGRSAKLIRELIGVSSLSAVRKLVESDPVCLASIVSRVI